MRILNLKEAKYFQHPAVETAYRFMQDDTRVGEHVQQITYGDIQPTVKALKKEFGTENFKYTEPNELYPYAEWSWYLKHKNEVWWIVVRYNTKTERCMLVGTRVDTLKEAKYATREQWISNDRMMDLIRAACFNSIASVRDFWEYYHHRLIPLNQDNDYAYQFLSDLSFKREQHVRSMNETLDHIDAPFRVSDMRWDSDEEEAETEWKVQGNNEIFKTIK